MDNIKMFNLEELDKEQLRKTEGGFIPLIILGTFYSAKVVAAAAGGAFFAGVAAGVAVAASD